MNNKYLNKIASTAAFRNAIKRGASKLEAMAHEYAARLKTSKRHGDLPFNVLKLHGLHQLQNPLSRPREYSAIGDIVRAGRDLQG